MQFEQSIFEKDNPGVEVGKIKISYNKDLSVDYEYNQGEHFHHEDSMNANQQLKIQEVYKECSDYFDALVELFEEVYNQIYPQIGLLPSLMSGNGKPNIKPSPKSVSMDNYFTVG